MSTSTFSTFNTIIPNINTSTFSTFNTIIPNINTSTFSTFNTIIPNINTINANSLRVGFFDGTTQWFHLVNIKIINSDNVDIAPSCVFTPTSTSTSYQSPGVLKTILTDDIESTYSHSELLSNTQIKIDFGKTVAIKQIILENRTDNDSNRDRIKNAQFKLYDTTGNIVYESNKITEGSKFYHVNVNSKAVKTGLPSIVNANILRFGFFDGTTQWLHVVNIKIINENNEDIAPSCIFTPTSTSVENQSPGTLKEILTDNKDTTFSHSKLERNTYIKVDFGKTVPIKQILIENRNNSDVNRDRIKNVQFKLYDPADKIVYESDKITIGNKFYFVNVNSKAVSAGLPLIGGVMKMIADTKATMDAMIQKAADVKVAADAKIAATVKALDKSKVVADTKAAVIDAIKPAAEVRNAAVADAIVATLESGKRTPAAVIAAATDAIKPATEMRNDALVASIKDNVTSTSSSVPVDTVIDAVEKSVNESTEKRDENLASTINTVMTTPGKSVDDVVNAAIDSLNTSAEKRDEVVTDTIVSTLPVDAPPASDIDPMVIGGGILLAGIVVYFVFFNKPAAPAAPSRN